MKSQCTVNSAQCVCMCSGLPPLSLSPEPEPASAVPPNGGHQRQGPVHRHAVDHIAVCALNAANAFGFHDIPHAKCPILSRRYEQGATRVHSHARHPVCMTRLHEKKKKNETIANHT